MRKRLIKYIRIEKDEGNGQPDVQVTGWTKATVTGTNYFKSSLTTVVNVL